MTKTLESIRNTGEVDEGRHEESCLVKFTNCQPTIAFHWQHGDRVMWELGGVAFSHDDDVAWFIYLADLETTNDTKI